MRDLAIISLCLSFGVLAITALQFLWIQRLLNDLKKCEKRFTTHLGLIVDIDVQTTRLNSELEALKQVMGLLNMRLEQQQMLCEAMKDILQV